MMSINIIGHPLRGEKARALADVLNNHNCISELHLGNTHLTGEEIATLTKTLTEKNSAVHTLDLRLNTIDLVGAKAISEYLSETRFLRELNLSSTELDSEGFCKIISAISGNKSVVEFDGSFLDVSDECGSILRDMLRINTTLQKLRLRGNNISSLGCQTFCKGLVKNIALSVLDLSRNPIGDGGVEALAQNLPDTYVTELYIDGCGITSKGGQSLAEIISRCKKLKQIDVSTNQLEDTGLFRLAPALEHTSSLVTLCLNMCSITNDGFAKMLDVLQKNISIEVLKLCFNKLGEEHTNAEASSDNLRHRLRIISSSKPKLKIMTWGNKFDET